MGKMTCPACARGNYGLWRRLMSELRPMTCPHCGASIKKVGHRWTSVFLACVYVPFMPLLLIWLMPKSEFGLWLGLSIFVAGMIAIPLLDAVLTPLEVVLPVEQTRQYRAGGLIGKILGKAFKR